MSQVLNYVAPDSIEILIDGNLVLCTSDLIDSPEKDYGFEWNDDLY